MVSVHGFILWFQLMVRASGKSSGLLGRGALATLSKNPDDLNNGIQLVVPAHIFHFMVPLARIG